MSEHDSGTFKGLRNYFDGASDFMSGHQIVKVRTNSKKRTRQTPDWARSDAQVRALLLRSFPKLSTDKNQRVRAGRWARVIILYFKYKKSCRQVAEEMYEKERTIEKLISRVKNVAAGLQSSGRPLGVRPRGRPKKIVVGTKPLVVERSEDQLSVTPAPTDV